MVSARQMSIHAIDRAFALFADQELSHHERQTKQHYAQNINQQKSCAAILAQHIGEFPHIAQPHRPCSGSQDHTYFARKTIFIHRLKTDCDEKSTAKVQQIFGIAKFMYQKHDFSIHNLII